MRLMVGQAGPGRAIRVGIGGGLLIWLTLLTANLDYLADRTEANGPVTRPADNLLLPPDAVLRTISLGQVTLMASVLWVKAVAYFGERFSTDRKYRWLETYIDTIAAVDPKFRKIFEWGGVVVMYGGRIDNTSVRASIGILQKGLERFPDDWQLAFMLGCNYVFELSATDPEQKKRNIEQGIEYLRRASYNKDAPPMLTGLVSSLYRRVGWLEAAATYLEEAYLHAEDPKLREQLGIRLKRYRDEAQLTRLQEEVKQFEQDRTENYPYLPPGLFRLVGRRDPGRVLPIDELRETAEPTATAELATQAPLLEFGPGALREDAAPTGPSPAGKVGNPTKEDP